MPTLPDSPPQETIEPTCSDCGRVWIYGWGPEDAHERCHSTEAEDLFRAAIRRHLIDNGDPKWHVENDYATSHLRIMGIVEHIYLEEVERMFPAATVTPPADDGAGHVVYRHYTVEGILLYVGYSSSVTRRQRNHEREAPWWPESARMEVVRYDSREEALTAELAAIRSEHPLWNVQGNAR